MKNNMKALGTALLLTNFIFVHTVEPLHQPLTANQFDIFLKIDQAAHNPQKFPPKNVIYYLYTHMTPEDRATKDWMGIIKVIPSLGHTPVSYAYACNILKRKKRNGC